MAAPQAGVSWSHGVDNAWSSVATFLPELALAIVVLLVGYVIAKAVAKAATRLLVRIGFERAAERGGLRRALVSSQYNASTLLGRVVYYGLMLLVLQVAFSAFGPNPVSTLIDDVVRYVPKVLAALVIVVVAAAVASAAKDLVANSLAGLAYGPSLAMLASAGIVTVGVFAALSELMIAPMIVNGLFYAILVVVAGSAVVAIGGGGIQPMRARWERALTRYDEERPFLQERARAHADQGMVRGDATSDVTQSMPHATPPVTPLGTRRPRPPM